MGLSDRDCYNFLVEHSKDISSESAAPEQGYLMIGQMQGAQNQEGESRIAFYLVDKDTAMSMESKDDAQACLFDLLTRRAYTPTENVKEIEFDGVASSVDKDVTVFTYRYNDITYKLAFSSDANASNVKNAKARANTSSVRLTEALLESGASAFALVPKKGSDERFWKELNWVERLNNVSLDQFVTSLDKVPRTQENIEEWKRKPYTRLQQLETIYKGGVQSTQNSTNDKSTGGARKS